jgi:hypothetical protein
MVPRTEALNLNVQFASTIFLQLVCSWFRWEMKNGLSFGKRAVDSTVIFGMPRQSMLPYGISKIILFVPVWLQRRKSGNGHLPGHGHIIWELSLIFSQCRSHYPIRSIKGWGCYDLFLDVHGPGDHGTRRKNMLLGRSHGLATRRKHRRVF